MKCLDWGNQWNYMRASQWNHMQEAEEQVEPQTNATMRTNGSVEQAKQLE